MYITKQLEKFSNKRILHLMGAILAHIFVFSTEACSCKPENNTANIVMKVDQALLIGKHKGIELSFQVDDSGNRAIIGDFKLKASIVEQKSLQGSTTGSHIKYEEAANDPETGNNKGDFSQPLEKLLSEFTNYTKLDTNTPKFEEKFKLVPAQDAIYVKIHFELTSVSGEIIDRVDVEWIKSEIIINIPGGKLVGETNTFTIISLKEDIKDLSKLTLQAQSSVEGLSFLLGETKKSKTTLSDALADGMSELAKGKESNPIKIVAHNPDNKIIGDLTISIFTDDADRLPWVEQTITWSNTHLSEEDQQKSKKEQEQLEADEREKKALEEKEKKDKQAQKEATKNFKAKEKELKEQEKKELEERKKQEEEALKQAEGNGEELTRIKQDYQQKNEAIKQKYTADIAAAKQEFEDTKKANEEKIKEEEKRKKEIEQKLKEEKEKQKEEEKKKNAEEEKLKPLQIEIAPEKRTDTTKTEFTIKLHTNKKIKLQPEDAEKLHIWYELQNLQGNPTGIKINHGKIHIKPGKEHQVTLSSLFEEKIYTSIVQASVTHPYPHDLEFHIHPEAAESMELILHLEHPSGEDKHVTIKWDKMKHK